MTTIMKLERNEMTLIREKGRNSFCLSPSFSMSIEEAEAQRNTGDVTILLL